MVERAADRRVRGLGPGELAMSIVCSAGRTILCLLRRMRAEVATRSRGYVSFVEVKSRELAGWMACEKTQATQRGFSTQRLPATLSRRRWCMNGVRCACVWLLWCDLGVRGYAECERRAEAEEYLAGARR
jgi:hypothetical protein